jgi:hypothetical protein
LEIAHACFGLPGCSVTVIANDAPPAIEVANANTPFTATLRFSLPLSVNVSPKPVSPETEPPTVKTGGGGGDGDIGGAGCGASPHPDSTMQDTIAAALMKTWSLNIILNPLGPVFLFSRIGRQNVAVKMDTHGLNIRRNGHPATDYATDSACAISCTTYSTRICSGGAEFCRENT